MNKVEITPITETNNFIILDKYTKIEQRDSYQTEADLERELIADLQAQGYEYRQDLNSQATLLANLREQLQKLNNVQFSDAEWARFLLEYLDKPAENLIDKTRKIHHDYIYDFVFDNGRIQNIALLDKKHIQRNFVQVIHQFEQTGTQANRYDVTILINGLPLIQIELKKRGVAIKEAFNQIHRYTKESFNHDNSLFKFLQIFVISNGTNTRYFANTTKRDKNSFDFTMHWAKSDNTLIKDLKDFTATFLSKNTLLNVLINYSVFDTTNTLLIMRPYQIAATERLLWKVKSAYQAKNWSKLESGGYIWHTTGSGKTLTSFKAARLATELDFIQKVFFVVDRKDLDYQTMKEYQRFSPDSVNGSNSTAGLKRNIEKEDNKIIVTTIQKLNNLMKSEDDLAIYQKQVVFIFDECHRSQFGEAQKNLKKKFKQFYQFGFTGTPIFKDKNALGDQGTEEVFGNQLHSYVITDAIRDEKVLKFKVDYNDVRPKFKSFETEKNLEKLTALETKQALLHPERVCEITQYILNNFKQKTHRLNATGKGFNAMFAVSSVEAAKLYYESFKALQQGVKNPLKVATIFSFAANEAQDAVGDIEEESFEPSAMNSSAKEFLQGAIDDYNHLFQTNYGVESNAFQNYYRDLAKRVKNQEIDLLIVVGMFLTGFDAPCLNTLFVDKNLRYHGLIQAYSRTNRILNANKTFGNIVTFRDLEQATIDAITLFGAPKETNVHHVVLEKNYQAYMEGYTDELTGEVRRGYLDVVKELQARFPDPAAIETEKEKKDFVKLFGEYLRLDNILQNYDEYADLQKAVAPTGNQVEEPAAEYLVQSESTILPLTPHEVQDYRSTYNDIRDWLRREKANNNATQLTIDWDDVVFEVDLLKSQEINLDYILELIFEQHKKNQNKPALIEEMRKMIRASVGSRAKESLVVDFINQTNLDAIPDKASIIDAFFAFAQAEQQKEAKALIESENLNEEAAKRYLAISLKREYASENGTELHAALPALSPLNPEYRTKKQTVFQKISAFIEKFKGVGGKI
ncbi:type I restriction endonuclease subunit R [Pasteurella multocida]|uniref:type I restriction endonuclease subunit R n=1 Tax=Pasteurella multocida TaxID=747 RepID=UPI0002569EDF|nr:type I restriction endonuclease subunit R [Pasteurella multocida]AFF24935.1 type I site-specific deoxyribonuclease [Pasteurella multocida subsp. multocida str. HN06]MCL7776343.1 type I restriction endonuclease subunit R [Pasteurella multocida]MCL8065088.1 type I restriction endonuclease subunit R [Pasteurella multocida]MCL8067111.1 type I restriction endonuclease subunit R [Pasteurella multocida]MCW4599096.1 type I restriction endonuclease subunit R [Pasteurella multocida subsp. multocida]